MNFATKFLIGALTALSSGGVFRAEQAMATEQNHEINQQEFETIFDSRKFATLEKYFSWQSQGDNPPHFLIRDDGGLTYKGDKGNFGLLVMKEPVDEFIAEIEVSVPESSATQSIKANSGIYLRIADPRTPLTEFSAEIQQKVAEDARKFGDAPWIAAHTGFEVQLETGYGIELEPEKRAGAFYSVPFGNGAGQQVHNPLTMIAGEKYQLRIIARKRDIEVLVRPTGATADGFERVSFLRVEEDLLPPMPRYFALQSYYSNGTDFRSFVFWSVKILRLASNAS